MKKKIIISIVAILIISIALALFSALLVPKYISNPEGRLTGEYYSQSSGNDVIFLGDCEVYETFVPAVLWEKYGISSYVRGSAQQLIWQSYYILEETLKYETPKAVVFNVYSLKYGTPQSEAFNRMTFDTMKWSKAKFDAIKASMTEGENIIDYIFPLLRYHSRISELEANDFKYWFVNPDPVSDSGYLMQTGIAPRPEQTGKPRELRDYDFSDTAFEYLDKMNALCDNNGIELILVKAPTNSWNYYWYDEYEAQVESYAQEKRLKYYNLIESEAEIGIDWNVDTYDEGFHLNVYGAEKTTEYFGKILSEECGIPSRREDEELAQKWNERVEIYKDRKEKMEANEK
ncbi:MAG: SGNH/GDSL hydrolase family protein [Ruminococcaceae bacterium]|nr:SGNH/GDSL hydrolase family protein [Oscillospiraceae bacterium]